MKYLSLLFLCGCLGIKLVDHKYEDVFIVIQKTVGEDPTLIQKIKETFTLASKLLFTATNNRVYFGKISIIIPKEWTTVTNTTSIPSIQLKNYIMIDEGKIKNPFVKSTECGKEGIFLYLPPSFLMEKSDTAYGRKEKVIVHEWGQLRWGLFSEYHPSPDKKFYLDEGRWKPTVCTDQIQGQIGKGPVCLSAKVCDPTRSSVTMSEMCSFCPHLQQTANASIMGYQYIPSVNFFCDKDDPSVPAWQRHNKKAPTKQNLLCNGKSAWEVMREHSDFRTGSTLPEQTNTEPIFEVLKETNPIRVFVLDTSGSMSTDDRIGNLHRAGAYIINRVLEENSWLGVVCFTDHARITADMTHIISDSEKKNLVASLPTSADGGTCIGCGIHRAIEMLKTMPRKTAENAEIILMSDGEDQNNQMLTDASREAIESKVVIHTVSISQQADPRMISLARDTGGKHYTYLDKGDISFSAIFSQVITISATDMTSKPETVLFKSVDEQSFNINFNVTLETGMNTTISVLTKLRNSVNLTLEITGQSVMRYQSFYGTSLTYQIPETFKAGQYQVIVTSSRVTSWEYTVSSLQSGSNQIMTTTRLSKTTMDFTNAGRDMPVVYADVTKGFAPVTNVEVVAFVEGTDNVLCNITLRDNGQEPDIAVDDGTYSAFILPSCMASKRLNLRVEVFGREGQAGVQKKLTGAIAIEEPEVEYEVLKESFQRFSIPEPLFVKNLPADLDLPPGRITDLSVVDIKTRKSQNGESRNFTIAWTATGNDMNVGQATSYDIRIAEDIDTIMYNFTMAEKFSLNNDTFVPKPSGTPEAIRISVNADESYTGTAFLGIVAVDKNNNTGQVSNVVSILVAKGFRIEVEEVKNYTIGMFNNTVEDETDIVDEHVSSSAFNTALTNSIVLISACVHACVHFGKM